MWLRRRQVENDEWQQSHLTISGGCTKQQHKENDYQSSFVQSVTPYPYDVLYVYIYIYPFYHLTLKDICCFYQQDQCGNNHFILILFF